MKIYGNLNDLFSSLDITALSHCCQIGSQCHWSSLQNVVERFRFSVLSWSYEVLLDTKWLRRCVSKTDLGASAANAMLLFGLCNSRLIKSVLNATFEVLTVMLLKIEVFWEFAYCCSANNYRHFKVADFSSITWRWRWWHCSSSERWKLFSQSMHCYTPDVWILCVLVTFPPINGEEEGVCLIDLRWR